MIVNTKGLKVLITKAEAAAISITPTAISSAAPAEVTATNTLKNGDVVFVENSGFPELDGKTFVVGNANATDFSLLGSDTANTTGSLAAAPTMSATAMTDFQVICASAIAINSNEPGTVSVATFCDPSAQVSSVTVEPGTLSLSLYHDPSALGFVELTKAKNDNATRNLLVVFPQDQGVLVATGTVSALSLSDIPLDGSASWSATFTLAREPEFRF